MTSLKDTFATAHKYRLALPCESDIKIMLDDVTLTKIHKKANEIIINNRCQSPYVTFSEEVRNRLQEFLRDHHEAPDVAMGIAVTVTDEFSYDIYPDAWSQLYFNCTEETVVKLRRDINELLANLQLSAAAIQKGIGWNSLSLIKLDRDKQETPPTLRKLGL